MAIRHEGKRIAVEQVLRGRKTGREVIRPYGDIAFPRMWDEYAGVEAHMLVIGETGKGTMPRWYVERKLDCGVWITCRCYRPASRDEALNIARSNPRLRAVERNAADEYVPIYGNVPEGTKAKRGLKGSKGMW